MKISTATALATVPQPFLVLGTPLRPFCLGHHLLFRRLQLPFADAPEAEATDEEILVGVAICSADYEQTLNEFLDDAWADVFAKWRRKVTGRHRSMTQRQIITCSMKTG